MVSIRTLGIAGALTCGATLASCALSEHTSDGPTTRTHTVIMEGMAFSPEVITVTAGDSIVWINKDLVPHTATSSVARLDSKIVEANKSWHYKAERTGDFDYFCSLHPTMSAKLLVR
jgi:plastocyanin